MRCCGFMRGKVLWRCHTHPPKPPWGTAVFGFSSTAWANVGLLSDFPLQWFVPGHLLILLVWMDCLEPRPNLQRQHAPLPKLCSNALTHTFIQECSAAQCRFTFQPAPTSRVNTIPKTAPHTEESLRGFISSKRDRLLNKVCVCIWW